MCRTSNKMKRTACIFSRLRDSIWKVPGHQELWAYLQNQSSKDEVHSFIFFFMLDFPVCFHLAFVLFFFLFRWINVSHIVSESYSMG